MVDVIRVVKPADHIATNRIDLLPGQASTDPSGMKPLGIVILAAREQLRRQDSKQGVIQNNVASPLQLFGNFFYVHR
jgi:hypothetical protein